MVRLISASSQCRSSGADVAALTVVFLLPLFPLPQSSFLLLRLGGSSRRGFPRLNYNLVVAPLQLCLVLPPPLWESVEQAQRVLCRAVEGHFVFVLAPLLSEGTDAFVHPLVAVNLGPTRSRGGCSADDVINLSLFGNALS